MRSIRQIAAVASVAVVAAGLGIVGATSASAVDNGPLLPGTVYLFNNGKNLATALPSDQVTGGTYAGQPFTTVAVDTACPAGSTQLDIRVRLKTASAEANWDEVMMTGTQDMALDVNGHPYALPPEKFSNFTLAQIQGFLGSTGQTLPLAVVCEDNNLNPLGYFQANLRLDANTTTAGTWNQVAPTTLSKVSTTTTLGSLPASVEQGTAVSLSATVAPAAATGTVEYFDGSASLGTSPVGTPLSVSSLSVGSHSITAVYSGNANYLQSTSAAGTIAVSAVAARATTTTLAVDVTSGDPYQAVTLKATVAATTGSPAGTVTFSDNGVSLGSSPVDASGVASVTKNTFAAGAHSFTAAFVGTAPYTDSASAAVAASYVAKGASDEGAVQVVIPAGAIAITTPYTAASPLSLGTAVLDSATSTYSASAKFGDATDPAKAIKITDTRSASTGWVATVLCGDFSNGTATTFSGKYAGLTDLKAVQVSGNALLATDVAVTNHPAFTDGLASAKTFATYAPAAVNLGTAQLDGTFAVSHVPTSVTPGTYTAKLVFTAN